jgi:hypothetical protein
MTNDDRRAPRLSPARGCRTHQPRPFAEIAVKPEFARFLPAKLRLPLVAFAAFAVGGVPIIAARDEDVQRERVVVGTHFFQYGVNVVNRLAEVFQGVLQLACAHCVQTNINMAEGQF